MLTIDPQYIIDNKGNKKVILSIKEFQAIMEEIDELEDIKLYDATKKDLDSLTPIDEAFKIIESRRKK